MNNLSALFEGKKRNILSVFVTAGFPEKDSTVQTVLDLDKEGVDLIELGIPFSDPMADGATIQFSSEIALNNGMNIELLFEQVKEIRKQSSIPIVLMGYLNPIYQFGMERFISSCKEFGVDGLIIPDISFEIYERQYEDLFVKHDLPLIFLITPNTKFDRIQRIDKSSKSFIYLLSSSSVTGQKNQFSEEQIEAFERVSNMNLSSPILCGFGIHDAETFSAVCDHFNGAIVGSAFIRSQMQAQSISEFVSGMKDLRILN